MKSYEGVQIFGINCISMSSLDIGVMQLGDWYMKWYYAIKSLSELIVFNEGRC